ncbi:hypothetical protein QUV44_01010 [Parasutterella secunda]|uniref:hypothetical protein n=1 Tax=Parasutterella secunda TaxID=626947 RepID=UPI0025A46657|nr:hypothetical protein [Parasutterella secunda]MDM8086792.1 hypothetical protein [Parasutterella secunda]
MRKYPYYLYVHKATFNVGPDIKRAIRRAKPEETDWYMKTQVADVGGYGPKLFEYSLKKRWPDNKKEQKRIRLGRILELNNGTSILFHKTSSWRIEFLDVSGRIVDRCKRNDSYETKLLKIKLFIEKSYPHYRESNVADRIAATILSGFGKVWLEFYKISKDYLFPLCKSNEMPTVFWDLQDRAFIYDEELPYFSDKDSGICHTVFSCYTFDWEYFKKGGLNNWYWLHYHRKDQRLKLRHVPKTSEFDLARYGAFEIIFKSPFTDYEGHKIAAYSRVT